MFRNSTSLSGAHASRRTFSLARAAATSLAGLLFAVAAHAAPQISSLVHAPGILPAGGTVTSTVTVAETDSLPILSPGMSFTYTIPANAVYMGTGAVPVGSCSSTVPVGADGPGTLTCSGITLVAGQAPGFEVLLRTRTQGTLSVTATPSGGGMSETKTITVNQGADMGVTVSAPANAASGSTVPIVFTLTNNGPDTSSGSTLTYPIPTGLTVSGSGLPSGCSISGSQLTCNVPATPATPGSNTRTFSINGVVTAGAGSTITHQPAVEPAGSIGDGVSSNNSATANTTVTAGYVLALAKSHDGGQLLVGQHFNFRLSPRFSGSPPTGVTLSDTIPANFAIQLPISPPSGWTCSVSGQLVNCTRSNIGGNNGASVALGDIVVPVIAVAAGTGVVNEATVSATGPIANSATGSVPADVAVSATDFRADKRRGWPQNNVPLGQAFDYQVGSTNLGGTRLLAGSTIQLLDDLPAGVQINSVTQRDGYTCTVMKGGATVVPTPAAPVPGPATVTCTRTLAADIDVDLSAGNSARNGGYIIVNATIPAVPPGGGQIVNRMCVNVALPAAAPTLGTDPDGNTGNDCVNLGTGVNDNATAARREGAQARGGHRRQRGQPPDRGPGHHVADRGRQRRALRGAERRRHRHVRAGDWRRHRLADGQRRHLQRQLCAAGQRQWLRQRLAVGLHAVDPACLPRQHRPPRRVADVPGHSGRRQALRRWRLGHRSRLSDQQHGQRPRDHAGRSEPGQQRRQCHRLPRRTQRRDRHQVGQPRLDPGRPTAHLHARRAQPEPGAGQPQPRLRRARGRHAAGQPDVHLGQRLGRRQLHHGAEHHAAHGHRHHQQPARVRLDLARPQRAADRHGARAAAVRAERRHGDQRRAGFHGNARDQRDQQTTPPRR
jgi:hypothetical protein